MRNASWFSGSAARMSLQMDSASSGSFRNRYSSTFEKASSMPSLEIVFNLRSMENPLGRLSLFAVRKNHHSYLSATREQRTTISDQRFYSLTSKYAANTVPTSAPP